MNLDSLSDSRVTLRTRIRTATREAILGAAAELLGRDSASQTRMEDIAARAGVAVGTVYNYFEDRTALVSALLETRTTTLLETLGEIAGGMTAKRTANAKASPADEFAQDLTRFVATLGAHFDANRFLLGVIIDEEHQRGIDAKSASRRRTVLGDLLVLAERLMEKGIRTRSLRKDDPTQYAAILVGMVRGVAQSALARHNEFSAEGTAAIVRVFMTGAAR